MAQKENTNIENRLFFMDNLKTFIIFLVVIYHAGWCYEGSRMLSPFWIVDDPMRNDVAGLVNLMLDLFMMPTLFFVSGFFAPISLNGKSRGSFIVSRFKRLMVPWIIAVFTLLPLYQIIFFYSRDLPQQGLGAYFHFTGGIGTNQGWLWFLPVLFLFDLGYALLSKLKLVPVKINFATAVFIVFCSSFGYIAFMNLSGHAGWTKTILIDFQNERLLVYFLLFLLGAVSYQQTVFKVLPNKKTFYYILCSTLWIPMNIYIGLLINMFLNPGKFLFSEIIDKMIIWLSLQLSMLGMLYILINTFRFYFDSQGLILKRLSSYSYGVYILHMIVVGGFALLLLNTSLSSMAKYLVVGFASFITCNLMMAFYKEILMKKAWYVMTSKRVEQSGEL